MSIIYFDSDAQNENLFVSDTQFYERQNERSVRLEDKVPCRIEVLFGKRAPSVKIDGDRADYEISELNGAKAIQFRISDGSIWKLTPNRAGGLTAYPAGRAKKDLCANAQAFFEADPDDDLVF